MSRKRDYDTDDFEYSDDLEESDRGGRPMTMFLVILGVLLLALTVMCVLLTVRLRSQRSQVEELENKLAAAQSAPAAQDSWTYPDATPQGGAQSAPGDTSTPAPLTTPEPTPAPTPEPTPEPTPVPTPTPAPVITTEGGLPSWLTEANMAKITKRPKDDEWYAAPGKLYVTAEIGLNMRSGPDASYALITTIPPKTEVTVYASHDNWRFVQDLKGNFGWVSNNMLSNEAPEGAITGAAAAQTPTPTVEQLPEAEAPAVTG